MSWSVSVLIVAGASSGCAESPRPPAPSDSVSPGPHPLRFESIQLPEVTQATDFAFLPGSEDELLVVTLPGRVHRLRLGAAGVTSLGVAAVPVFLNNGCGLHSIALDPDFEGNAQFYLARCTDLRSSEIVRVLFDGASVITGSEESMLRVGVGSDPREIWHRIGSIGFEPDGQTLWALVGDHFVREEAQDPVSPLGALLRIVPSRATSAGAPAAEGNAFGSMDGAGDPRVYAYGFRSPWRGTRDPSGRWFVGDVGEYAREEVDVVRAAGENFGWPRCEGPCMTPQPFTEPVASYGRSSDEPYALEDPDTEPESRRSVWVADAYPGADEDRYEGFFRDAVVFGDFYAGWVRRLSLSPEGGVLEDTLVGHLARVTAWHAGPRGQLFALTLDGALHRVILDR